MNTVKEIITMFQVAAGNNSTSIRAIAAKARKEVSAAELRIANLETALEANARKVHAHTHTTWRNGVSLGITFDNCPDCAEVRQLLNKDWIAHD